VRVPVPVWSGIPETAQRLANARNHVFISRMALVDIPDSHAFCSRASPKIPD
jgi:hypothetical protein